MRLVRFFGEPAVIPARLEGEALSKRSQQFTDRQLKVLVDMAICRRARLKACNGGTPYKQIGQYIEGRR